MKNTHNYPPLAPNYLSLSFGIEGLSLMAAAWMLKEKTLKSQAFAVIFILVSKLLFVDLANRSTLEHIVSFIGAGVAHTLGLCLCPWHQCL